MRYVTVPGKCWALNPVTPTKKFSDDGGSVRHAPSYASLPELRKLALHLQLLVATDVDAKNPVVFSPKMFEEAILSFVYPALFPFT